MLITRILQSPPFKPKLHHYIVGEGFELWLDIIDDHCFVTNVFVVFVGQLVFEE